MNRIQMHGEKDTEVLQKSSFLLSSYRDIDFFINRQEILSSIFLSNHKKIRSNLVYLSSIMEYVNEKLLLLDLDLYLRRSFKIDDGIQSNLVLIMDMHHFSDKHQQVIRRLYERHQLNILSSHYIAVKINSSTEIVSYDFSEISLIPPNLRIFEFNNGVLGLRTFQDRENQTRIQYWLDLETIVFNKLIKTITGRKTR